MNTKTLCITIAVIILALVGGYAIGRYATIHQATLYNITDNGYDISFGNSIHSYTLGIAVR